MLPLQELLSQYGSAPAVFATIFCILLGLFVMLNLSPESKTERLERVPVTIITGFRGSGKTTLLNHILTKNHGMKFAIIEIEFGEVGVDDGVLKAASQDQIIEVMNGCICCTVRGDLAQVLKGSLAERLEEIDCVIIETTGLADPAPVAQAFCIDRDVMCLYRLEGIVTIVDAKHILEHLQEEKPEGVENESVEQVAFADRILLNKTDLATEDELVEVEKAVRAINASAEVIRTQHAVQTEGRDIYELLRVDDAAQRWTHNF